MVGAALFAFGPYLVVWLHLAPKPPDPNGSGTLAVLEDDLTPGKVTRIDVLQSGQHVVLERGKQGWTLAGKWPARKAEVEDLVTRLTDLRSRFVPIPLHGDPPDLAPYGLDRPPVTVTLHAGDKEYRLDFGIEPGDINRYSRPTYARLTEDGVPRPEVIRLDPGLVTDLERPLDYYYKRGLFLPADGSTDNVARALTVTEAGTTYSLTRGKGDEWQLTYPVAGQPSPIHDRPDPDRLKSLLKAVPDIWAERFVENKEVPEMAYAAAALCGQALPPEAGLSGTLADLSWAYLASGVPARERLVKAGTPDILLAALTPDLARLAPARLAFLDAEARRQIRLGFFSPVQIRVTRPDGEVITLLIGGERTFDQAGSPAHTVRYARLVGNDQLFEIKVGSYESLLASGETLRDDHLARFDNKDVRRIEVDHGGRQLVLVHTKEKPKSAEGREEDRWKLEKPLQGDADSLLVSELLGDLNNLRLQFGDLHYRVEPKKDGLDQPSAIVRLTLEETKGEGPARTTTTRHVVLHFGKPKGDKTYVKVDGRDLITSVSGPVVTAVNRQAMDLIKRDLLTVETRNIQRLKKTGSNEDLTLQRDETGSWQVKDAPVPPFKPQSLAVDNLLGVWANLRAERYVSYGGKEDLARYGLDKPDLTVTITEQPDSASTAIAKKPVEHTLYLGKPVESPTPAAVLSSLPGPGLVANVALAGLAQGRFKDLLHSLGGASDERYARLGDRDGVFVLGQYPVKELKKTYLDFVDAAVLKFEADQVKALQRQMGKDSLEVDKGDAGWELVKPTRQRADDKSLDDLLGQLANLKAKRVAAYPPRDLRTYGLDTPVAVVKLRLADPQAKPVELHLGKLAEDHDPLSKDDRYGQAAGSAMVVVVPGNVARRLVAGTIEFRDRTVPTFREADGVTLERGPRRATFTKVDGTWKLTAPVQAAADHDKLEDFVNKVARLRADEWVTDKPADLKTYGLDHPQARWHFLLGNKPELELLVGSYEKTADQSPLNPGKRCYARLGQKEHFRPEPVAYLAASPWLGFPAALPWGALARGVPKAPAGPNDFVFLLDPKTTEMVLAEYRDVTPWTALESGQVDSLTYHTTKGTFTLKKVGTVWQVAGKSGASVNTTAVTETLDALSKLKAERYVVDQSNNLKAYGLDPAQITIEIQSRTGGKYVLQVGHKDPQSGHYYARVPQGNRTDVFLIGDTDAGHIVRDLAAFTQPGGLPSFPPPGR